MTAEVVNAMGNNEVNGKSKATIAVIALGCVATIAEISHPGAVGNVCKAIIEDIPKKIANAPETFLEKIIGEK